MSNSCEASFFLMGHHLAFEPNSVIRAVIKQSGRLWVGSWRGTGLVTVEVGVVGVLAHIHQYLGSGSSAQ